jgi:hypothetical protein
MLFSWRASTLVAVGAGGAFLLDGLVTAAGSIFLWIGFITKLSCNLLLMSIAKKCATSELGGPASEVKRGVDLIIKGKQHNQIQEMDWLVCLVLNKDVKYRSSRLTGGFVFTAQQSFVLWFEASYLQKVILIKSANILCNEMVANELDCFKFKFLRRMRLKKRASSI